MYDSISAAETRFRSGAFFSKMKLKLAQGLLNQLHSIIDLTGQEK